jgi:type I restriction enzyme, R subunit
LDGDDKTVGNIVDYKDLFRKLVNDKGTGALQVYSSELDQSAGGCAPEVMLQDRLAKGRERLDNALEAVALICEPVLPPRGELEHIHYFCGNVEIATELALHEPRRVALYTATVSLVRAYAAIADDLAAAGYSADAIARIRKDVQRYLDLREIVRKASGETIDLKAYEADMRHLIDTYIEADEPRRISAFGDMPLLELIAKSGIEAAISSLPEGIRTNPSAVAETIANNVRSKIVQEHLTDPAYYDRMSLLLAEILADLRAKRIDYQRYLHRIAELARQVVAGQADSVPPILRKSAGLRAIYNNLEFFDQSARGLAVREAASAYRPSDDPRLTLAVEIDQTVRRVRPDDWRGHQARENAIKRALLPLLHNDADAVERIFLIIVQQREY